MTPPSEYSPTETLFKIVYDRHMDKFKLVCKNETLLEDVRFEFSDANKTAFFVKQYGFRADQRLYVINKFGYFDIGLFFDILKWIKTNYGTLSVVSVSNDVYTHIISSINPLKSVFSKMDKDSFVVKNISEDRGINQKLEEMDKQPFIFRDYQRTSILELLFTGYGRGLIEIPTGGGKSFIIANLIYNLDTQYKNGLKYMILVPTKQLVEQFYSDLLEYGYTKDEITRFTAGLKKNDAFNPNAQIIVANRQFIQTNFEKLPKIDCVIVDEVHTATSKGTQKIIENLKCNIRFGCSGTLPRDKYNKLVLIGMFSKIIYEKKILELQQSGYISDLHITLLNIKDMNVENNKSLLFNIHSKNHYSPDDFGFSDVAFNEAYKAELEYTNKYYRELYTPVLNYVGNLDGNTLILFHKIEFGVQMCELAKELMPNKTIYYIDGHVNVNEREQIRSNVENSNGSCIIFGQTAVFSTGINIKNLTNVCFSFSGKSFSRTIQSIGRALRLFNGKQSARLIDCVYNYKYSRRHYSERQRFYGTMYGKKKPDEIIDITID